jgi:hypothetical protein
MTNQQPKQPLPGLLPSLQLTPEELSIITMMRRNSYQEIEIQVQDSVITSVDQTLKYRRKKGGGLVGGVLNRAPLAAKRPAKFSIEEISIVKKIREKPFQKITVNIKNGIDSIYQTLKFRKTK